MKNLERSGWNFMLAIGMIVLITACQSEQQSSTVKKSTFEITPLNSEVHSKEEHVSVTISDTLNLTELGLSLSELIDYQIYLYVHPLNAEGWWRQNPAVASRQWTAQAFLGGVGEYSAKDGDVFQIAAILAKQPPPEKVDDIRILREMGDIQIVSNIRTLTVRRK